MLAVDAGVYVVDVCSKLVQAKLEVAGPFQNFYYLVEAVGSQIHSFEVGGLVLELFR